MKTLFFIILSLQVFVTLSRHSSKSLRKNKSLATTKIRRHNPHSNENIQNRIKRNAEEGRLKRLSKEKSHTFYKDEQKVMNTPLNHPSSTYSINWGPKIEKEEKGKAIFQEDKAIPVSKVSANKPLESSVEVKSKESTKGVDIVSTPTQNTNDSSNSASKPILVSSSIQSQT